AGIRDYAVEAKLPVVPDSCPACFGMPTQREHMKALLANEEAQNKDLFKSLLRAMTPLISKNEP
ncbi:MAG: tRNA 2-thiocytidine biosynthesis protein TtcA, partial [Thioalkalispiraceae bacterium]